MIRPRPLLVGVAAWVVGAVASVLVGLLALSLVGEHVGNDVGQPLAADPIAQVNPPVVTPIPQASTGSPVPSPAGAGRRFTSAGGEVVAQCRAVLVYLLYWTPAQGYRADEVVRGPAMEAKAKFTGQNREVELKFRCVNGVIQADIEYENSEHQD